MLRDGGISLVSYILIRSIFPILQTSLTTTTDSDTGTVTTLESTGCASSPCTPLSQFLEGLQLSSYCCKDRLCNNGGMATAKYTCPGQSVDVPSVVWTGL